MCSIITYFATKYIDKDIKLKEELREIQRKKYEEFVVEMEDALEVWLRSIRNPNLKSEIQDEVHTRLNKLTWKMYISASDNVIKAINNNFSWEFNAEKRREVYFQIRKQLIWETNLWKKDLLWWSKTWNYE